MAIRLAEMIMILFRPQAEDIYLPACLFLIFYAAWAD